MKSRNFIFLIIALLALPLTFSQIMSAQALYTLTPESEAALSATQILVARAAVEEQEIEIDCSNPRYLDEIPDRIFKRGTTEGPNLDELLDIWASIECMRDVDANGNPALISREEYSGIDLIDLFSGGVIELSNGRILDGRKLSVRAKKLTDLSDYFRAQVYASPDASGFDGDGICSELATYIREGATAELQFAVLVTLVSIQQNFHTPCVRRDPDETIESHMNRAANGDLDGAVSLGLLWFTEILADINDLEDNLLDRLEYFEKRREQFHQLSIENTTSAPLLSHAAAYGLLMTEIFRLTLFAELE